MKVWIVAVSDCESNNVVCLCSTKTLAEKKMFEERDKLVVQWKESLERHKKYVEEYIKEHGGESWEDNMYQGMIDALKGDDYEKWYNFPHETPHIYDMDVLEE